MSWLNRIFKRQEKVIKTERMSHLFQEAKKLEKSTDSLRDQELRNIQSCLDVKQADLIPYHNLDSIEDRINDLKQNPTSAGSHEKFKKI